MKLELIVSIAFVAVALIGFVLSLSMYFIDPELPRRKKKPKVVVRLREQWRFKRTIRQANDRRLKKASERGSRYGNQDD